MGYLSLEKNLIKVKKVRQVHKKIFHLVCNKMFNEKIPLTIIYKNNFPKKNKILILKRIFFKK